jgi:hypothetical protein
MPRIEVDPAATSFNVLIAAPPLASPRALAAADAVNDMTTSGFTIE